MAESEGCGPKRLPCRAPADASLGATARIVRSLSHSASRRGDTVAVRIRTAPKCQRLRRRPQTRSIPAHPRLTWNSPCRRHGRSQIPATYPTPWGSEVGTRSLALGALKARPTRAWHMNRLAMRNGTESHGSRAVAPGPRAPNNTPLPSRAFCIIWPFGGVGDRAAGR